MRSLTDLYIKTSRGIRIIDPQLSRVVDLPVAAFLPDSKPLMKIAADSLFGHFSERLGKIVSQARTRDERYAALNSENDNIDSVEEQCISIIKEKSDGTVDCNPLFFNNARASIDALRRRPFIGLVQAIA